VSISYESGESGIAKISLERPEAMNAMDDAMYREITECLRKLEADDAVEVGIVTGNGQRAFSAGADLKDHPGLGDGSGWTSWRPDRWDLGFEVSKPLIAAIDGYALAGGLELALICDIRLATPRSHFGAPEIRWNMLHGRGALCLPAVVGLGNAMMMLLTGEFIDADEALRIGLINRQADPADLMDEAEELARRISGNASDAVRMTKELALRGAEFTLEQGLRMYQAYAAQLDGDEQLRRTDSFGSNDERENRHA
jgi:enoyl-CoA hydratase/carnithine racemase